MRDGFTGEIKDFYEFGSRVKLLLRKDHEAHEVILTGREHIQIGGAFFGAVDTEAILYVDVADPEYDSNRRYIPIKERTKRALVSEIKSIEDLYECSTEQTEDEDVSF